VQYATEYPVRIEIGVLVPVSRKHPSHGGRIPRGPCRYFSAEGMTSRDAGSLHENSWTDCHQGLGLFRTPHKIVRCSQGLELLLSYWPESSFALWEHFLLILNRINLLPPLNLPLLR
jgi:hypothetical protein